MQTWSGWRYKSENKARRCVVTVVIVVNAATSKMNHQMQPDLSTMVTMTIRMVVVVAGVCCGCGPPR